MAVLNYCVFIDVLGYGELVKDTTKSIDQRINILNSIYSNLATTLSITINEINSKIVDKIFIKSFSDCFYLESTNLLALLYSCERIYNDTFGLYSGITDGSEYTPLVRGGIVKDWTVRFSDLAGIVNNQQIINPVGLGVARAYWTSEKSKLSGMRMIISKEVIDDVKPKLITKNGLDCFGIDFSYNGVVLPLFFNKIETNEENIPVDLFELIWPDMSSCTYDYVDELKKIKKQFDAKSFRHFNKTAEIILKGLIVSDCQHRTANVFGKYKSELENMVKEAFQ